MWIYILFLGSMIIYLVIAYFSLKTYKSQKRVAQILMKQGVETSARINCKDKSRLYDSEPSNVDWKYFNSYMVVFQFDVETTDMANEQALNVQQDIPTTTYLKLNTGVSTGLFGLLKEGNYARMRYLKEDPKTAVLLNPDGSIGMPRYDIVGYVCLLASLGCVIVLLRYMLTESTF